MLDDQIRWNQPLGELVARLRRDISSTRSHLDDGHRRIRPECASSRGGPTKATSLDKGGVDLGVEVHVMRMVTSAPDQPGVEKSVDNASTVAVDK